jgi:predicted dehydrogenase
MKLRYALIGCGRIAVNHIDAVLKNKNIVLVALCDIDLDQINKISKKTGLSLEGVVSYSSHGDLLKKEKLDLVGIATESGAHAEIAIDCLKKGINVIVEKPMALSIKDANKMIEIAKKNKVKLAVCHQNRFNKVILKLKKIIDDKKMGKINYGVANIRWNRNEAYYKQASWRGKWATDGGCLMNQCIHNIDLLLWMIGSQVTEVYGCLRNNNHGYNEGEDLGIAILKFKNGSLGVIEGTVAVYQENWEETLSVFGYNGLVEIGGKSVNKINLWKVKDSVIKDNCDEAPPNIYGFGHNELYKDFISAIKNKREPLINGIEGKKALEVILAIYKSHKERKNVFLPLKSFKSKKMINCKLNII